MKARIWSLILLACLLKPLTLRADLFGADVAVLTNILVNALQQLAQLRAILSTTQDNLSLMREVYRGMSDSLNLLRTINPDLDPGTYRDWATIQDAMTKLERIYGKAEDSPAAQAQRDADQSIAEAVTLNNDIYKYTQSIDQIGEAVKSASHSVSQLGAEKLTAQTLGVMLHVMDTSLRAQATGLKLQAQALAVSNKKDKELTRHFLSDTETLRSDLKKDKTFFALPRFQ